VRSRGRGEMSVSGLPTRIKVPNLRSSNKRILFCWLYRYTHHTRITQNTQEVHRPEVSWKKPLL